MSNKQPGLHTLMMLGSAITPFWFRVNPWPGQTEVDFFLYCVACAVVFFFGYMRWFAGSWRPIFVIVTAYLVRLALLVATLFAIWFLFLRTPGCWELKCKVGEIESVQTIKARFCKENPSDSRCP